MVEEGKNERALPSEEKREGKSKKKREGKSKKCEPVS
jgi:hypothetical protein